MADSSWKGYLSDELLNLMNDSEVIDYKLFYTDLGIFDHLTAEGRLRIAESLNAQFEVVQKAYKKAKKEGDSITATFLTRPEYRWREIESWGSNGQYEKAWDALTVFYDMKSVESR